MPQQTTYRRYERVDCQRAVTVTGPSGVFRGDTDNISETGIAIALPKTFADKTVTIEICDASGAAILNLTAERCHNIAGFHGFQFTGLTAAQRAVLRRICAGER